jgi:chromosome segregation ATPase
VCRYGEVYEAEQISANLEGEVSNFKDNVTPKLEEQLVAHEATAASCEKERDEAEARLGAFRDRAAALMETKRAAEAKFKETERGVRRADTNLLAHQNTIKVGGLYKFNPVDP